MFLFHELLFQLMRWRKCDNVLGHLSQHLFARPVRPTKFRCSFFASGRRLFPTALPVHSVAFDASLMTTVPSPKLNAGNPTLRNGFHKTLTVISEGTPSAPRKENKDASRGQNRSLVTRVMKPTSIRYAISARLKQLCVLIIFLLRKGF